MPLSYGYIETLGFIAAVEAADAMLKAAEVTLVLKREIGSGLVTVIIEGQLGAVQSAIDAGCAAVEKVGQLISFNVIARPYNDADFFTTESHADKFKPPAESYMPVKESVLKSEPKIKRKIKLTHTESASASPQDLIISILQKQQKAGASLNEISAELNMEQAEVRIILKDLLDKEIIEKVQQKYFKI